MGCVFPLMHNGNIKSSNNTAHTHAEEEGDGKEAALASPGNPLINEHLLRGKNLVTLKHTLSEV
jgi:hypothetical protein